MSGFSVDNLRNDHIAAAMLGRTSPGRAGAADVDVADQSGTVVEDVSRIELVGLRAAGTSSVAQIIAELGVANLRAITPAQLVANTDDWDPVDATDATIGLSIATIVRASTDASRNLTGIVAPTSHRLVFIENVGAFDLVLKHNVTSTAANRFTCPNDADYTLQKDSAVVLEYDVTSTTTRWRVVDNLANLTVLAPTTFTFPSATAPAQTAEGSAVWDSDDDVLTVGDGASRSTFGKLGSTNPVAAGTVAPGSSKEASRVDHVHPQNAVGIGSRVGCLVVSNATTNISNGLGSPGPINYAAADLYDTNDFHFISAANLSGTVAKAAASAAIVGTGTSFTTELSVNQVIAIPGTAVEIGVVKTITDNTHLTLWRNMANTASGQTAARRNDCVAVPVGYGGTWLVRCNVEWDANATGQRIMALYKNGAEYSLIWVRQGAVVSLGQNGSAPAELADGDYIQIFCYQDSGGTRTVGGNSRTNMSMTLIGA